MVEKTRQLADVIETHDVACVIHGGTYTWDYVERLHNMVVKNSSNPVRFHVFTEHDRSVPDHMIKHVLTDWPDVSGPKKSWWYKLQLFDSRHIQARLLYLDLDTILVRNIDWIWALSPQHFWTVRDFRHLWRSSWQGMNSSVMLWDTMRFGWIWRNFEANNIANLIRQFHGDQDYLNSVIDRRQIQWLDSKQVKSWRWQIKDGGMDIKTRVYRSPDAGSVLDPDTSIIVFHGRPKPHEIHDSFIANYWC